MLYGSSVLPPPPHQPQKIVVGVEPSLTKLSGSAHVMVGAYAVALYNCYTISALNTKWYRPEDANTEAKRSKYNAIVSQFTSNHVNCVLLCYIIYMFLPFHIFYDLNKEALKRHLSHASYPTFHVSEARNIYESLKFP